VRDDREGATARHFFFYCFGHSSGFPCDRPGF
jgi:hypothetical protein